MQSLNQNLTSRIQQVQYPMNLRNILSLKVIDGDTLEAIYELDSIENIYAHRAIRLTGIDTPEKKLPAGKLVKEFVETWVHKYGPSLKILTIDTDKYNGRIIGDIVRLADNKVVEQLSHTLLLNQFAKSYSGRSAKKPWTPQELEVIESRLNDVVTISNYGLYEWIPCSHPKPIPME
jgi:hypothetical protein